MRRKAEATTKKPAKGAMALATKASANARRGAEKKVRAREAGLRRSLLMN
jgi:hypothetical protein